MTRPRSLLVAVSVLAALGGGPTELAGATAPRPGTDNEKPATLREVGFDQRLGTALPLDVELFDEQGNERALGEFFRDKPVVLAFVYYDCPMLCTLVLNGIVSSLRAIDFKVGEEFDVIAVSFDPRETPELALEKRTVYVGSYNRSEDHPSSDGWHFLTGRQEQISRLTDIAGFRYVWDEEKNEFAHAAGIMVVTPEGRLSRYLYGIDYSPTDLRLALVDASGRKIGNAVDELLLYCFHYDPATGQYSMAAMTAVRIGGAITLAALLLFLFVMFRRERKQKLSVGVR